MKFLLALIALFAVAKAQQSVGYCQFVGTSLDTSAAGGAYFVQPTTGGNVTVSLSLTGITVRPGQTHGFHIHQFGNITDTAAALAVGTHFAGAGSTSHGCPTTSTRHEGDMGNVAVDASGNVTFGGSFDLQTLVPTDANSIIGHAAIFHSNTDDCLNTTSSGSRLAQCVIGIANPDFYPSSIPNVTNTAGNQAQTSNRLVCYLQATSNYNGVINGYIDFTGTTGGVLVTAVINGLSNLNIAYGLHIHQYGDLTGNTGNALGGHYNPTNSTHGIPPNTTRHIGDLGNVCGYLPNGAGSNTFYYQYLNDELTINGMQSFVGRGIALHNKTDVQGATAYGTRVGHCVIGVADANAAAAPTLSSQFSNFAAASCSGPFQLTPSVTPTSSPTSTPTSSPSTSPTSSPTSSPSTSPTSTPTTAPTTAPTEEPSSTTTGGTTTSSPTRAPSTSSASSVAVFSVASLVAAAVVLM